MKALLIADGSDPATVAPVCRDHGVGVEVQAFHDPAYYESTPDAVAFHEDTLADIELRALHAPFRDLRPGAVDSLIRAATKQRLDEGFAFAEGLGARYLVAHNGYTPGLAPAEVWNQRAVGFWKAFLDEHDPRIQLCIENVLEPEPDGLIDLIDCIGDRRVRVNLDIGHVHCHSNLGVVRWVEMLGPRTAYVHLHDNHGAEDEHLGLGKGTIPLVEVCHALEQHAPDALWTIEAPRQGIEQSMDWLRSHGLR